MEKFLIFYQNIPMHINPIAFKIGFFQIGWYALMYFIAFAVVYGLLKYRVKKGEWLEKSEILDTFLIYAILAVLIGGRLGYVLFYNLPYYLVHPLEIISPYDFVSQTWIGIYGMSYHGGLLAVILTAIWFCRKNRVNLWQFSDFIVPAVPLGYFFGRIGNFLNGELYGRVTKSDWGMYFFDGKHILLRYPSQLLEAFLEGAVIFLILWPFRNKPLFKNKQLLFYIILYGIARFLAEFFREPDEQIGLLGGFLTRGQIFSLIMIMAGFLGLISKSYGIMKHITLNKKHG